ncbi:hypothetical protein EV143_10377 [Flavobacterium chryseum]|uniref:hypothetical protein n=1 Tax=Flavobacterium sp. P3160 TaxID=2512113 RepID=UPI00105F23AF|nr:hypothetical protein [Flavobacterium sp. P3160]TDO77844.1 hypothetical protein EV143_10377 [Flavobacterium sp. P3160]
MEPNNFEKDFRDKLNQRKIEPSDKAWDRLDAMLSIAERTEPKETSKRKWLYVAASIVGFLLIGTFFFNQKKNTIETLKENVVIEENLKKDSILKPILNTIDFRKTEIANSEKSSDQTSNKEKINLNNKSSKPIKKEQNQIAESSIIIKNNQENQTINNQISTVETSKNENRDQLINSAEKTAVAENSAKAKKIKVNAGDLLNQVDGELELSFREKIITKVNKNYQTVKVAVTNRNQQE